MRVAARVSPRHASTPRVRAPAPRTKADAFCRPRDPPTHARANPRYRRTLIRAPIALVASPASPRSPRSSALRKPQRVSLDDNRSSTIAKFKLGQRVAPPAGLRAAQQRSNRRGEQRPRQHQLPLPFPFTWGGARRGAGRKRSERGNTPHLPRPRHRATEPVHVTLRARFAPLRSQHVFPSVRLALLRAGRRYADSFRLLHFSVQHDHLHLIVEANDKRSLSSGIRSIAIRVARYVNDLLSRRGPLWADRFHSRALKTPREVRNALVYVLANFRKHARRTPRKGIDPFSSGVWFNGWREWRPHSGVSPPLAAGPRGLLNAGRGDAAAPIVSAARSWLVNVGWRRRGLIGLSESPAR